MEIPVKKEWLEGLQKHGQELEAELKNLDPENPKELRLQAKALRVLGYIGSVEYILENIKPL